MIKRNSSPQLHYVFVYGTLKEGYSNSTLLQSSRLDRQAMTVNRYRMKCNGYYPSVLRDPENSGRILGEVYEVTDETLKQLDRLEGTSSGLYYRDQVQVKDCSNEVTTAWMYIRNGKHDAIAGDDRMPVYGLIAWGGPANTDTRYA